jgi:predicted rRNA methylase YqxC with S4 and FtsJ domains
MGEENETSRNVLNDRYVFTKFQWQFRTALRQYKISFQSVTLLLLNIVNIMKYSTERIKYIKTHWKVG